MAAGLDQSPNRQGNHAWIATSTGHLSYTVAPPYNGQAGDTAGNGDSTLSTVVTTASATYTGMDDFRFAGPPVAGMSLADQLARQWPLGN